MKKSSFFWVSYTDLMTSLFFIMLVLYVITLTILKGEMGKIVAQNEQLKKITQIEAQFKPLQKDGAFSYLEVCNKYVAQDLIGIEIFESNEAVIKKQYVKNTIEVGIKIETFLNTLLEQNPDFKYLLVIEGNMANTWDMKLNKNSEYGYKKSYERALTVYNLWLKNNISFRKENIEVLISGSGFNGLCRDKIEENNKRFSIQIIPKVSKIEY